MERAGRLSGGQPVPPRSPGDFRAWRTGRGSGLAVLTCLALAASACGGELTFSSAQTSFRSFSECAVIEDLQVPTAKFKEAWLQNVDPLPRGDQRVADKEYVISVAQADPGGGPPQNDIASLRIGASQSTQGSAGEAYLVTGVIRATNGGVRRDDLTVLVLRKVLGEYKVVSWTTNVGRGQKETRPLPDLVKELPAKSYRGRCSW